MFSEFPLFVFTTLAGLSAGAYFANAAFPLEKERRRPWLFDLVCLVLLAAGFIGCLCHLARPALFLKALSNPGAGIAREAYPSILYGVLLFADFVLLAVKKKSPRALQVVGGVVALVMTVVMGMAYIDYLAVPAWNTVLTVPLFVFGDLAMGAALLAVFDKSLYAKKGFFGLSVAAQVLTGLAFVGEALHFSETGMSPIPFVTPIVIVPVLSLASTLAAHKKGSPAFAVSVLACAFVGVCIARIAFYMAY